MSVNLTQFANTNEDKITDIDTIAENYFSQLRTKSVIEPTLRYNAFPELSSIPPSMEMDFSRILNKPFFVANVNWATTNTVATFLTRIFMPGGLFNNNLAKIPFNASSMYRAKISLLLQVSGTPMHQGLVLAAASPRNTITSAGTFISGNVMPINTLLSGPHVFLNANEANAAMLEVPFYVNTKLDYCAFPGDLTTSPNYSVNYADVNFFVMNPLFAPAGASASVTISVYAIFNALEFYVPHIEPTWTAIPTFEAESLLEDLKGAASKSIDSIFRVGKQFAGDVLDSGRAAVRHFTGLHSPNYPELVNKSAIVARQNQNMVDVPTQFEKLDPFFKFDRILRDHTFDTTIDEMDVKQILSKPQYIGTFRVNSGDAAGILLFSRPIVPNMEAFQASIIQPGGTTGINTNVGSSLQRTLALMSRFWKGELKIHIQAVMSNFHFCKLSVARNYCPNLNQQNSYPAFADVSNLMTEVVEFSGGGQVQTISLPYCSVFNQLPIVHYWTMNTMTHGMFYIYLNQPLVVNGTVSPNINFNVYLSCGDDFELYGYDTLPLSFVPISNNAVFDDDDFKAEAQATVVVNKQQDLLLKDSPRMSPGDLTEHRPIESIRDWVRRPHRTYVDRISAASLATTKNTIQVRVAELLRSLGASGVGAGTAILASNIAILRQMYLGFRGGLKIKAIITGAAAVKVDYHPPNAPDPYLTSPRWRYTSPYPTVAAAPGAAAYIPEFGQQNQMINDVVSLNRRSMQTVGLERPNYYECKNLLFYPGPTGAILSGSNNILEFEIPYMSPYRFVGTTADHIAGETAYVMAGEMGHLIFTVQPDEPTADVNIEMYVAFDDTARMGYQVFAPVVAIPALPNTTTPANTFMAIPETNTNLSTYVTPGPAPNTNGNLAGYYFRS